MKQRFLQDLENIRRIEHTKAVQSICQRFCFYGITSWTTLFPTSPESSISSVKSFPPWLRGNANRNSWNLLSRALTISFQGSDDIQMILKRLLFCLFNADSFRSNSLILFCDLTYFVYFFVSKVLNQTLSIVLFCFIGFRWNTKAEFQFDFAILSLSRF